LSGFVAFLVPMSPVSLVTALTLSGRASLETFGVADAEGFAQVASAFAVAAGAFAAGAGFLLLSCVWVVLWSVAVVAGCAAAIAGTNTIEKRIAAIFI
jgi:hypothetical protein